MKSVDESRFSDALPLPVTKTSCRWPRKALARHVPSSAARFPTHDSLGAELGGQRLAITARSGANSCAQTLNAYGYSRTSRKRAIRHVFAKRSQYMDGFSGIRRPIESPP